jgi:hypothetical protein
MGGVVTLFSMLLGFVIFRRREHRPDASGKSGQSSPIEGAH